jgi:hypothetical protein
MNHEEGGTLMADNYERFVRWYLRFNGYFTVENFYVHTLDKPFHDHVRSETEADIIGIRMRYSSEVITGTLEIANHHPLVDGANGRFDIVIAEVKNSKEATPNPVWKHPESLEALATIEYVVRFVGVRQERKIRKIARQLALNYRYVDNRCRIRYIMFSESPNKAYTDKGVQHISFQEIIRFLDERAQCYKTHGPCVASVHYQWDPLINEAFRIFNSADAPDRRRSRVLRLLKVYRGIFTPEHDYERLSTFGMSDKDVIRYIVEISNGTPEDVVLAGITEARKLSEEDSRFVKKVLTRLPVLSSLQTAKEGQREPTEECGDADA